MKNQNFSAIFSAFALTALFTGLFAATAIEYRDLRTQLASTETPPPPAGSMVAPGSTTTPANIIGPITVTPPITTIGTKGVGEQATSPGECQAGLILSWGICTNSPSSAIAPILPAFVPASGPAVGTKGIGESASLPTECQAGLILYPDTGKCGAPTGALAVTVPPQPTYTPVATANTAAPILNTTTTAMPSVLDQTNAAYHADTIPLLPQNQQTTTPSQTQAVSNEQTNQQPTNTVPQATNLSSLETNTASPKQTKIKCPKGTALVYIPGEDSSLVKVCLVTEQESQQQQPAAADLQKSSTSKIENQKQKEQNKPESSMTNNKKTSKSDAKT
ncbi:hypothetical protein HY605_01080, partial [Candidatus Peregrinibacteria bacterium]|nr:hypothetical protein [Candidatus Peregrinibacteria bacterium]